VLLVDGSTFTVGPDSDLVIDKFVYDSNKGTGQIAASFSKGVMRFVGGKISKADNAVTINTPHGAVAVRGCITLHEVTPTSLTVVLVYGNWAKWKNLVAYEPGYAIMVNNRGSSVKLAPPALINAISAGLSPNTKTLSNNDDTSTKAASAGPKIQMIETADFTQMVNNAITLAITTDFENAQFQPPPEPVVVTTRVLTPPGVYYIADGTNIPDPADHGILGGGTYPGETRPPLPADDFAWQFNVSEGRFTGTVEGLTDVSCSGQACEEPITSTPLRPR
jgi:hypothetical protein